MASKSKKRRRVLGASCILAALIIAGSSFAWFTSSDEVTNRLSANADYDVSIVESFAPPKNWLPGENVNKDVYALNTGTIGAFVNEDVSGVLSYTAVHKVATREADCVKLTEDEVDSVKAGAYLAGAFDPTTGKALDDGDPTDPQLDPAPGGIYEYFNNGKGTDPKTTDDFTPTKSGLYFFRRSIGVETDGANKGAETFKYEGYYFDNDTKSYYKLSDIKINEALAGVAGDKITSDGTLTACPTVMYEKEVTDVVVPKLTYEPKVEGVGGHPQRLVATVNTNGTGATNGSTVDANDQAVTGTAGALKELKAKKAALDTAKTNYDAAVGRYNAALTTIKYYAGDNNGTAKTINKITDFTSYVGDSTTPSGATKLPDHASDVFAPGILRKEIDDYNSLIDDFKALATSITNAEADVDAKLATLGADETAGLKLATKNAKTAFENAKTSYNNELGQNYDADIANIGNPSADDSIYQVWQLEQAWRAAQAAEATAQSNYDAAVATLNTLNAQANSLKQELKSLGSTIQTNVAALNAAIEDRETDKDNASGTGTVGYDAAKTAYESALAAYNTALKNYNDARAAYEAADNTDTNIKIYINLSDDVVTTGNTAADKWQLIPIVAGNSDDDKVAHFYYTGILEGGESSAKLIDSIELDKDTKQDAYKSFDFDLNVHLDSAQIAYEDDQKTIKTDSVTGPAFENRAASLTTPTSLDTPVLWS